MAWSNSKIFRPFMADMMGNTAAFDLDADTIKGAHFDNSITPNQDVSPANSAYGAGVWASGGVGDTNWPAAGLALSGKTVDSGTAATVFFDATDLVNSSTVTLVGVYGLYVYDDTLTTPVADQGICYLYYGGAQTVTAGQLTVVFHANGLARITL